MICRFVLALAIAIGGSEVARGQGTLVFLPTSGGVAKFVGETGEFRGIIGSGFVGASPRGAEMNPADGYLYVTTRLGSPATGAIVRLEPYTGAYAGLFATGFTEYPDDIAFGADGLLYVADWRINENLIHRFVPSTGEYRGSFAQGFLSDNARGQSIVMDGNTVYVVGPAASSVVVLDGPTGAYQGLIGAGFFTDFGPLASYVDVNGDRNLLVGRASTEGSVARFRTRDRAFRGMFATSGFAPNVLGIGQLPNGQALVRAISSGTHYVARFVPETGEYKGLFAANWGLDSRGLAVETPARVLGQLTLFDSGFQTPFNWSFNRKFVFTLHDPSTGDLLETQNVVVPPSGQYVLETYLRRDVVIRVKGTHWLRRASGALTIPRQGLSGVDFVLINGDADGNNEVGPSDFSTVLASFGTEFGDPGYADESDLDGNNEVGPSDFSVVLSAFGIEGD